MSTNKRALVVDDSKSARLVLRRMLEKYDLVVDTVESARQALDFLKDNRPDVIFMDHMMPGMDGFEAIKAIKNKPETATIPVLMYTSKGGDLYIGQARALGAVDVLPKTVAPGELYDSLVKIGLLEDRRSAQQVADEDQASERAEDISKRLTPPPPSRPAITPFMEPGMERQASGLDLEQLDSHLRNLLEEQSVEFRKDVLLSMETVARQTGNKLNKELDEKLEAFKQDQKPSMTVSAATLVVLAALLLASLLWNFSMHRAGNNQTLPITMKKDVRAPDEQAVEPAIQRADVVQADTVSLLNNMWQTVAWAANQELHYPFDEIALDNQRADIVEQLLQQLAENGYTGTLILETHAGEFCLLGDQESGYRLPPPDLTIDRCEFTGNPVQPTDTPSAHQSLRFANFVNSTPLLSGNDLSLEVVAASRTDPLYDYPEPSENTTAQDWNAVAARNNRVVIRLEPQ